MISRFKALSKLKRRLVVLCPLLAIILAVALWLVFKPDAPPQVTTAVIENGSIQSVIETSGTVSTDNTTTFTIPDGAYVNEVFVTVGSRVNAGDAIATFDTSSLYAALAEKRTQYYAATDAYDKYKESVKEANANLPTVNSQIEALNKEIAQLEKESAEAQAKQAATTTQPSSSTTSTTAKKETSLLDELSDLMTNMINIKATVEDVNSMFDSFNSMNGSSFDMSAMMSASYDTPQYKLIQKQLELVELNTKQTTYETLVGGTLDPIYKTLVDSSREAVDSFSAQVDKLNAGWYADFSGVVTTVNIAPASVYFSQTQGTGAQVDMSTILAALSGGGDVSSLLTSFLGGSSGNNVGIVVENYDGYIASFSLDKYNYQDVRVGQQVIVTSVNDAVFNGEVTFVSASATENSSLDIASIASSLTGGSGSSASAVCKVKIFNPDSTVVTGFDVDLEVITAVVENIPVVPVEAVRYDDGGMYVWIYNSKDKTVTKSYVTFGASEDTKYELLSGASLGDTILTNPPSSLEDGLKVTLVSSN